MSRCRGGLKDRVAADTQDRAGPEQGGHPGAVLAARGDVDEAGDGHGGRLRAGGQRRSQLALAVWREAGKDCGDGSERVVSRMAMA